MTFVSNPVFAMEPPFATQPSNPLLQHFPLQDQRKVAGIGALAITSAVPWIFLQPVKSQFQRITA
jgi:hypothetical protein